jgi:hypothetical protein
MQTQGMLHLDRHGGKGRLAMTLRQNGQDF